MINKIVFSILLIYSTGLFSTSMDRVEINFDDEKRHYLIYKPQQISSEPIDLVVGLHGYTGTASGFESETTGGFNASADKYNFIAIYPQGSFFYESQIFRGIKTDYVSSWNDLTGSKTKTPIGETCALDAIKYVKYKNCDLDEAGRCAWASCGDDIGFIKKIIDDIKEINNIRNVYVVGMSNGGMMAHAFACKHSEILNGVINVGGAPHLGLNCIPKIPLNYIIYAGIKDDVVPPIKIQSFDKYFYEPMESITNQWSDSFECKEKKSIYNNQNDTIEEKIFYNCKNNVQIISLLNMDRGHTWPGIDDRNAGNCRTSTQNDIFFNKCKEFINKWGNEYLLDKLFNTSY